MTGYYDDNYGWYEIDCEEDIDYYFYVQANAKEKTCAICKRKVMLMPHYNKCDSCMRKIEGGWCE